MVSIRSISADPGSLTPNDLPWIIEHNEDRCTLCGKCASVCPVNTLKLTYMRKRMPKIVLSSSERGSSYKTFVGIRQNTDVGRRCIGCGSCAMVCPNEAIHPTHNKVDRYRFQMTKNGEAPKRGGRRNDPGPNLLDKISFNQYSANRVWPIQHDNLFIIFCSSFHNFGHGINICIASQPDILNVYNDYVYIL